MSAHGFVSVTAPSGCRHAMRDQHMRSLCGHLIGGHWERADALVVVDCAKCREQLGLLAPAAS